MRIGDITIATDVCGITRVDPPVVVIIGECHASGIIEYEPRGVQCRETGVEGVEKVSPVCIVWIGE